MRKTFLTYLFLWCTVGCFSIATFAQNITTNPNAQSESFGQGTLTEGSITITHSATQNIVSLNSVSCNSGGLHTDNSYYRAFDLPSFGIVGDFDVTAVEIGVETCTGAGGTQPITCNLYTSSPAFPGGWPGSLTLIGTADVMVTDQALTILSIPVTGTAPAGSELVVEIFTPNGQTAGNSFFIGSNPDGETGPSYLLAVDCGVAAPTPTGSIGFPNMMIVMNVTGNEVTGGCTFFDDFESGLGNWTITNEGIDCVWENFFPPYPNTYTLPCDPTCNGVMSADADECGSGTTNLATTATLTTPIDATGGIASALLSWDNDWRVIGSSDEAHVELSTDGGSSWSSIVSWVGVDQRNSFEQFDITSAVNGTMFQVRFRTIQPGWDWWWTIDNVCIDVVVPVELVSFAATVSGTDVTLSWGTATETNNQGFDVQRNSGSGFESMGFVQGNGTSTEIHHYSFVDQNVNEGTYTYRLKQMDFDGSFEYSDVISVEVVVPDVYSLAQNYPNPFNPSTKINFSLAVDSKVSLKIFDVLGQEVTTLVNTDLAAGSHQLDFSAVNLNSGIYFYRIEATGNDGTNFVDVKKMTLVK